MIDYGMGVQLGAITDILASVLQSWRNDPKIWKWTRQNDILSSFDQMAWAKRIETDRSIKMYSIRHEDNWVGACGLTSIDLWNRRAEFSLYIAPEFMGRGLGKKALQTLLTHGFRNLGFNRIWGETFDGNPAMKMFLKLGFEKEGTRKEFYFRDGKFIDAHLFSMKAEEWNISHYPSLQLK